MFTKGSEFNLANWPSGNLAKWISAVSILTCTSNFTD